MIARLRRSNGNIYRDEQRRAVLKENNFFPRPSIANTSTVVDACSCLG